MVLLEASRLSRLDLPHESNLRRQDKSAAIVAFVEVCEDHRCFLRLIFVDEMTGLRKYLELILAC